MEVEKKTEQIVETTEQKSVKEDIKSTEAKPEEKSTEAKNGSTENGNADKSSDLAKKVVKQINYYFGDYNLPRDKFLKEEIKKDDGWVPLTTMLKFARLAKICNEANTIVAAIKDSADCIMEVDSSGEKIRRSKTVPLPDLTENIEEESVKRTIYCKGFPKDGSIDLDHLLSFFKSFGEYDAVRMRNFQDKEKKIMGFKGSVLVVFKTQELAKAFIDGPPTMHKKTYLIKKWFSDYLAEKKQEYEDRVNKKAARENKVEKEVPEPSIASGSFLKANGFADETSREDIIHAVQDLTGDCQFVDFRKGDEVAYLRFSGNNVEILAALKGNLKVKDAEITVLMVEGEEEEAQITKAKEAMRNTKSHGQKKRKGGFGRRGGNAKRGRR